MNPVRNWDLSRTSWMVHICWIFARRDMQAMPHCPAQGTVCFINAVIMLAAIRDDTRRHLSPRQQCAHIAFPYIVRLLQSAVSQRLSSGSCALTWSPALLMGPTLGLPHSQAASMVYKVLLLPPSVRTGVAYPFALRVIWLTICPPFTVLRRRRPSTRIAMMGLCEACARNGDVW